MGRKLPEVLTEEEAEQLLARPNVDCPTGLRNRAALELMLGAGLRASEVCDVHLRDVDWKQGTLRIRPEIAKYDREAVLPIDDRTREWLERWKSERRRHARGAPWLFCTLRGRQLDRRYIWEMTSRYARRAGIERAVWPHLLRHTFATNLLGDGFNLVDVQELMRHEDLRTTRTYLHVRNEELFERVRRRRSSS